MCSTPDKVYGDDFLPFYEPLKHSPPRPREGPSPCGRRVLCPVGEGDIPLKQIVNRLKADGYDGYALEWERDGTRSWRTPALYFLLC